MTLVLAVNVAAVLLLSAVLEAQQTPAFRAGTATVFVDVSVRNRNNPVLGLTSSDFVVTDNGVPQRAAVVGMDAVPVDVSLLIDTSGSTAHLLDEIKAAVRQVAAMLRPNDRFRLLTMGHSIYQPIPWVPAGVSHGAMDFWAIQGLSLVYDGVYVATLHVVEPGRRHLVVALTDGDDECSIIRPARLLALIERTDAAVHWIPKGRVTRQEYEVDPDNPPSPAEIFDPLRFRGGRAACVDSQDERRGDSSTMERVTLASGGVVHDGLLGNLRGLKAADAFRRVLEDYRQRYLLQYTPEGVEPTGWHELKVEVTLGQYDVRARSRYFGG